MIAGSPCWGRGGAGCDAFFPRSAFVIVRGHPNSRTKDPGEPGASGRSVSGRAISFRRSGRSRPPCGGFLTVAAEYYSIEKLVSSTGTTWVTVTSSMYHSSA